MSTLVSIRDLSVKYRRDGVRALQDVSLDIAMGERLAVIGESGSGKSTLALALAGLLPATAERSGTIEWPGLARVPVAGRDIGFVFQDAGGSLDPVMRVGHQVAEVVRAHAGCDWREANSRAVDLFGQVSLPDPVGLANAYPHQLSGGQKQRVAIAAAIAGGPRLLIADEPTSALDTIVQAEIVALVARLARDSGMGLVFISHDIALAAGLADRIAVFEAGRMVEIGAAGDLVGDPRNAYTRTFIEAARSAVGIA